MAKSWDLNKLADRWQSGMATAGQKWAAGLAALPTTPMAMAATDTAMNKYVAGVQQSVANGRRKAGLLKMDQGTYNARCQAKAGNLGSGAMLGKPNWVNAMQPFPAVWANTQATIQNMPKGGEAAAMAKIQVNIHNLIQAGKHKM